MHVARIYDDPPGQRVLVDRLWPRGISKERAALHAWGKQLAPSDSLRRAFHDGMPWDAFEAAYREELAGADLSVLVGADVLVTASKGTPCHADILLKVYQERHPGGAKQPKQAAAPGPR